MIIFEDFCEKYLKVISVHSIATKHQVKHLGKYQEFVSEDKSRNMAVFHGGNPLIGSYKQRRWAEDIRQKFIENSGLTEEEIKGLVKIGGNTDSSKFWIDNRNASVEELKKLIEGEKT